MPYSKSAHNGFTLIELFITFGVFAVLIALGLVILNPTRRAEESRDQTREAAVINLGQALLSCVQENGGALPRQIEALPVGQVFQLGTALAGCANCAIADTQAACLDLADTECGPGKTLVPAYLASLPYENSHGAGSPGQTGYYIAKTNSGAIIFGSCFGERRRVTEQVFYQATQ